MSSRRYAQQRDAVEPRIVECLRSAGCDVLLLRAPAPIDAVVGYGGTTSLVEFKQPFDGPRGGRGAGGRLTPAQARFLASWVRSPVYIVGTEEDALALLRGELEPANGRGAVRRRRRRAT